MKAIHDLCLFVLTIEYVVEKVDILSFLNKDEKKFKVE